MKYPIALIVYNRPKHTAQVLAALRRYDAHPLHVFSDGAKGGKDVRAVQEVRNLIRSIDWTIPTIIHHSCNLGLRHNIISAADYMLDRYEDMILLEDDCVPGPHFFTFMTECLDRYRHNSEILGVTGYTVPVPQSILASYQYDCYFYPRIGSWGWGTWRNRWKHYRRDYATAYAEAKRAGLNLAAGGSDIPAMIEHAIAGRLNIWTPGWVLANILSRTQFIYPTISHILNVGFDGSGVHCGKSNRYRTPIATAMPTRFPGEVVVDDRITANFRKYYRRELMMKEESRENVLGDAINETNPCPFCEAKYGRELRKLREHLEYWHIKCIRCGARGPTADSRIDAIAAWNRAAHWEDEQKLIEDLGMKLSQATSSKRMKSLGSLLEAMLAGMYEHCADSPITDFDLDDSEGTGELGAWLSSQVTLAKRVKLLESVANTARAWREEYGYCPVCSDPARGIYEHREDCPLAALDDLEAVDE